MTAEFNLTKLPETCYTVSEYSKELIKLNRGEKGYFLSSLSTGDPAANRAMADQLNKKLGVTKAQEQAMYIGSLFGFHVPGADPALWECGAVPIQETCAVSLGTGAYYLYIQTSDEGYDYTIYHSDLTEMDGGQLDVPSLSMADAIQAILSDHRLNHLDLTPYDPEVLLESIDTMQPAVNHAIQKCASDPSLAERITSAHQRSIDRKNPKEPKTRTTTYEQIH